MATRCRLIVANPGGKADPLRQTVDWIITEDAPPDGNLVRYRVARTDGEGGTTMVCSRFVAADMAWTLVSGPSIGPGWQSGLSRAKARYSAGAAGITFPSRSVTVRSMRAARSGLWVAISAASP